MRITFHDINKTVNIEGDKEPDEGTINEIHDSLVKDISSGNTPQIQHPENIFQQVLSSIMESNRQAESGAREFLRNPMGGTASYMKGFSNPSISEPFAQQFPRQDMEANPELMSKGNTIPAFLATLPHNLVGSSIDTALNPLQAAISAGMGRFAEPAVGAVGKLVGTVGKLAGIAKAGEGIEDLGQLFRTPNTISQRIKDISSRGTMEEGALKGYQDFRTGQIQSEGNKLIDSAIQNAQNSKSFSIGPDESAISDLQNQISVLSKGANKLQKQVLPQVAWQSGKDAVGKIQKVISDQGNKWNKGLQNLLGGSDADFMLDPQKVQGSLRDTLSKNGIDTFIDKEGKLQSYRPASVATKKIIDLHNGISEIGVGEGAKGYGIRELLGDKKLLGQSINYGKQWDSEDYLLNQARHGITKISEDVVLGLKEYNASWQPFADWKEAAVKNFDVYGGKYSEAGRPFIQKQVSGELTPAQQSFAVDTKSKIGNYSKSSQQVASGISEKQTRVENLKSTLQDLQDRIKSGRSLSPAEESNIKQTMQQHIDAEIQSIKDQTQKEIVGLQNRTGVATNRLQTISDAATQKINHLKAIGKGLAWTGGIGAGIASLVAGGSLLYHAVTGRKFGT